MPRKTITQTGAARAETPLTDELEETRADRLSNQLAAAQAEVERLKFEVMDRGAAEDQMRALLREEIRTKSSDKTVVSWVETNPTRMIGTVAGRERFVLHDANDLDLEGRTARWVLICDLGDLGRYYGTGESRAVFDTAGEARDHAARVAAAADALAALVVPAGMNLQRGQEVLVQYPDTDSDHCPAQPRDMAQGRLVDSMPLGSPVRLVLEPTTRLSPGIPRGR